MARLCLVAAFGLWFAGDSTACGRWRPAYPTYPPIYVPAYPLTTAIWGAPAPKPLPPPPRPFVPKPGAGVREEIEPPLAPKPPEKPKDTDPKDKETPRIPKVKLPLPGDPPIEPPPKREPVANGRMPVEQFLIPADSKRAEPRAVVKVGFFNHSDRAIELQVNGEPLQLPSEQYVTLRLTRTFTWAEKGQKGNDVVVPPDADGIEIVFRR
jgi:hypothetical protein